MAGKKSKRKQVHVKTPFSSPKHPPSVQPPLSDSEVGLHISTPVDEPLPSSDASVKMCRHLEKGIDVDKLSSQVSKSKFSISHCQDCTKESKSGTAKKGKGRSNRKKESAATADSAAHLQKKWVCLACGHVACGAFPISNKKHEEQDGSVENEKDRVVAPTGHVCKHSLCVRHPLALQTTGDIVWCFMCNMAVDPRELQGSNDRNTQLSSTKSPLQAALKVMHGKLVKGNGFLKDPGKEGSTEDTVRCHVVDTAEPIALGASPSISMHVTRSRRKRIVKGLMNLGNTCFFNSVMQNLLALDMLRDYFSQELSGMEGPLTSSLRKLYLETNVDGGGQLCSSASEPSGYESGLKRGGKGRAAWETIGGACNPRSLFGAICAKAPRFKGFQQQDSHELLRCLLDGLTLEERSTRVKSTSSDDLKKGISPPIANGLLLQNAESLCAEQLEGGTECRSSDGMTSPPVMATTFVESFFGGQLCSTVRCCECGHSSVVYEPMLDLSLQIPNPKKGQICANQSKLSSSGGGSQQRTGKHVKVLPKTGSPKVLLGEGPAVVDISKTSLQGGQSAQEDLTSVSSRAAASSPKQLTMVNSSSDDFGWLDFVGGGMQSAESSVQGSCDAAKTVQMSECNLAVDSKEENAANVDNVTSVSATVNVNSEVSKDASEFSTEEHETRLNVKRSEAGTSLNSKEEEIDKPLALLESEDGPLPLASGVVLLPYEPLEMSTTTNGENLIAFVKTAPHGSFEDTASPLTEPEGVYLDGFSQLFEEEESFSAASENMKPTCSNEEDTQVMEESAWDDGSCEVDSAVYGRGEVAGTSQSLADVEDAFLPMSLEGCLADFTKPELLSGENAWECESCTRRMKDKAGFLKAGENIVSYVSTEDMNGDEDHEEPASMPLEKDFHRVANCLDNGAPQKLLSKGLEGTSGDSNGSINGSSSFHLVVDHRISEYQNGVHLTESNDGQHLVNQCLASHVDGKVDVIMKNHLSFDNTAETHNLEQASESGLQGNGGNTSSHKSASKPSVEKPVQNGCNDVNRARARNKENVITVQNKFTKEGKFKSKSRQPPEKLVKKDATKKLSISKAPPILTVHLKRFAQDMRGRLSKLSGHVSFPEILDLRPFLDPRYQDLESCFYQLVGIVEHGGTMRGGHYIAYVRSTGLGEEASDGAEQESKDAWYCVSDSSVHKASLQAALNSEAYLLFYEKCHTTRESGST